MAAPEFRPDPERPGARIWRRGKWRSIGAWFAAVTLGLLGLGLGLVGLQVLVDSQGQTVNIATGAVILALTLFMVPLANLCWRHARGQWNTWIRLEGGSIHLHLPRDRSLVHRPPAIDASFSPGQIAVVEWRTEGYMAQGMAQWQHAYWLVLKSGERIMLFEDRSVDTQYEDPSSMPMVEEIAKWAGAPVIEKPTVEGKGGFLTAWMARPPAANAKEVTPERRRALSRGVAITRYAALFAFAVFMLSKLISQL